VLADATQQRPVLIACTLTKAGDGLTFDFTGTDPQQHAQALSYLHHHHLAPPEIRARALPSRYVKMDVLDAGSYEARKALVRVSPLIKGYLRLGGYVGDGAVIDSQFNTTDVFIIVKTELVTEKYMRHYERGVNEKG